MEEQFAKSNLFNGYIIENIYYKSIKKIIYVPGRILNVILDE